MKDQAGQGVDVVKLVEELEALNNAATAGTWTILENGTWMVQPPACRGFVPMADLPETRANEKLVVYMHNRLTDIIAALKESRRIREENEALAAEVRALRPLLDAAIERDISMVDPRYRKTYNRDAHCEDVTLTVGEIQDAYDARAKVDSLKLL